MGGISDLLLGGAPSIIQTGIGLAQSLIGGSRAKKAENELENLQTPKYTKNKSIRDYYGQALQRYNVNPYQSQQYQYAQQMSDRNLGAGIGALQDRRSAVGGISRLTAGANNAALRAGIAAEEQQNQRFNQLGAATGMQAADDRMAFQYNEIAPYEKQYNLLASKASGGARIQNAGLSNIFGGLQSASMIGSDYLSNQPQTTGTQDYNYGWNLPATYGGYKGITNYYKRK